MAHLLTGGVQGLNKNVVQSLIVLAPLGAFGLLELTRPIGLVAGVHVRWAVIGLIVFLMLPGAVRNRTWLEQQYPDLTPVVSELHQLISVDSVVMADTDALYEYLLSDTLSSGRIVLTYWVDYQQATGEAGAVRYLEDRGPDLVVLDGYYGEPDRHRRLRAAMGTGYDLRRQWPLELSWGRRTVELYERKGAG
jgi:hypothetical protein